MSLDQDDETIYADFDVDAYNDLIEYQFNNIVKLMSGLGMGESIQEKVLKELSANLASLMVMENWKDEAGWFDYPTNSSQSDTLHNNICKEQGKHSFYSEFVLQSIINMFAIFWVCQGGGVAYLNEVDKTLFSYVR